MVPRNMRVRGRENSKPRALTSGRAQGFSRIAIDKHEFSSLSGAGTRPRVSRPRVFGTGHPGPRWSASEPRRPNAYHSTLAFLPDTNVKSGAASFRERSSELLSAPKISLSSCSTSSIAVTMLGRLRGNDAGLTIAFALEHPPLDFVLAYEPELLVKNFALGGGIELHARNVSRIEVLDCTFKKRCADSTPTKFRVNQDHADPREPAFINDCRGSSDHATLALSPRSTLPGLRTETAPSPQRSGSSPPRSFSRIASGMSSTVIKRNRTFMR